MYLEIRESDEGAFNNIEVTCKTLKHFSTSCLRFEALNAWSVIPPQGNSLFLYQFLQSSGEKT